MKNQLIDYCELVLIILNITFICEFPKYFVNIMIENVSPNKYIDLLYIENFLVFEKLIS